MGLAVQLWLRQSRFQLLLGIAAIMAVGQMVVSRGLYPPLISSSAAISALANDVSLGYFSSWIFNILVVVCPAYAKRRRMKAWLAARYLQFKDSLVVVYLGAIGSSYNPEIIAELRDPETFRDYFSARYSSDQTRWHAVHNKLYEWGVSDIRFHCRLFISEYDLAIGMLGDMEASLMKRYGDAREALSRVEILEAEYDDVKRLLNLLFSIHCPWSFLDGKIHKDPILDNINNI
ncbi:MAG: hypothetical protein V4512_05995 [Pseudomonadota bacterium]